ncbi:MAG: CatB-related O-acetyltransferase [Magnetococcus sp. XQGC-1]
MVQKNIDPLDAEILLVFIDKTMLKLCLDEEIDTASIAKSDYQDRVFALIVKRLQSYLRHSKGMRNIVMAVPGSRVYEYHTTISRLFIGSFCNIGQNVRIFLGNGCHRTEWTSTYTFHPLWFSEFPLDVIQADYQFDMGCYDANGHVIIGNDVWLGSGCTLMSGVTIGDGAVVAANAHVVKNVGPYEIVGGNPAQLIKRRFTDAQIAALLELKWWDLPDRLIGRLVPYLSSGDIDLAIQKIREVRALEYG